jgi:ABC-type transporter Mla MlaB component
VAFSLFSKTKTDCKDSGKDSQRGDTVSPRTRSGFSNQKRSTENLTEVRRRQAEMAAKIDAIESEMTAEFPPLSRNTRKPSKSVPEGVDVPASVKREPDASAISKASTDSSDNPPTFTPTNLATEVIGNDDLKAGAVELTESSSLPPIVEETAMLFANGQTAECAKALREELEREPGMQVAWLLLFEIFQQTGNLKEFEASVLDYTVRFESSAPAWRDFQRQQNSKAPISMTAQADPTEVALPARMTAESQRELEAFKKLLKPGAGAKLNFEKLTEADEAGASVLRDLLNTAKKSVVPITMSGTTQAAFGLRGKLVINVKQPPEAVWLATLDLYHLLGWQRQFEDLAVDYAVTFEVSPPSYEPPPKHIHISGALNKEATLGDAESALIPEARPELKGDILGSASDAIASLETAASMSDRIEVDCSQLGRVDFSAAGSLLNWLLSAHARGKHFSFIQVHLLASALFTVVGINTVAEVVSRRN